MASGSQEAHNSEPVRHSANLSRVVHEAGFVFAGGMNEDGTLAIRLMASAGKLNVLPPVPNRSGRLLDGFSYGIDSFTGQEYVDYTGHWGKAVDMLLEGLVKTSVEPEKQE